MSRLLRGALHYIRDLAAGAATDASEGELLERFVRQGDQDAFAALLQRHGPMVLGVCRRLLDEADAEDAFQATFLVLVRRAGAIRKSSSVASWLYGVALRVSRRARADAARRRHREGRAVPPTGEDVAAQTERRELRPILDEELDRLPERYRAPLVLCYLEGKTLAEAARQLGCKDGTVCSRLARGRDLLRCRLVRRGLTPAVGVGAAALAQEGLLAAVPAALAASTASLAASESTAAGTAARAHELAESILKGTLLSRRKVVAAVVLTAGGLVVGVSLLDRQAPPPGPPPTPPNDFVPPRERATLQGHIQEVLSVAFSPDGKTLASASNDMTVKLWEVATGKEQATLDGHTQGVRSVAFSPDGKTLASGSLDRTIKLWEVATGKEQATLQGHIQEVLSVAFSPDGKTLASGSGDDTVKLWEVATGKEQATLDGDHVPVWTVFSVVFSPDGKTLASGTAYGGVKLWYVATGQERATLQGHADTVWSVCFSPDGKTLASGDGGGVDEQGRPRRGEIKLWDVATGQERVTFKGHTGFIRCVAFSPDGKALASSGSYTRWYDPLWHFRGEIKLWDAVRGQERASIKGHTDQVWCVAYSPDGKTLASASCDKTIKLWDLAPPK
jgi:RNA polymerase sigma factor (sigma-70 family)